MAPSASQVTTETPVVFSYDKPSKVLFPDGIKTSGQFDPEYDQLKPYEAFPKAIEGSTVWKADEYVKKPEQWTHYFSEEELNELSAAADAFIASDIPLTGICKVSLCRLPGPNST